MSRLVFVLLLGLCLAACAPTPECEGDVLLCDGLAVDAPAVRGSDDDLAVTLAVCGEAWTVRCDADGTVAAELGTDPAFCRRSGVFGLPDPYCENGASPYCVTIPCDGALHGGAESGVDR